MIKVIGLQDKQLRLMVGLSKSMNKKLIVISLLSMYLLLVNIDAKEENKMKNAEPNINIPLAIQSFVDTTNVGDSKGFVEVFTKDAYLRDWFRTFRGHKGVSSWDKSDNIGKNTHFDILGIHKAKVQNEYILKVKVWGDGFNGESNISFTIENDLIKKMIISPW